MEYGRQNGQRADGCCYLCFSMSLVVKYLSICVSSLGVLLHMLAVSLRQYAALISVATQCSTLVMHIIIVGSH